MRYGGSYAPYFGNLYGPPAVVTAPPYYGPYYGGYGDPGFGGGAGYGLPAGLPAMTNGIMGEGANPDTARGNTPSTGPNGENLPAPPP